MSKTLYGINLAAIWMLLTFVLASIFSAVEIVATNGYILQSFIVLIALSGIASAGLVYWKHKAIKNNEKKFLIISAIFLVVVIFIFLQAGFLSLLGF